MAANYGGQWDIVQAAQQLAQQVQVGTLTPDAFTPELFQQHLSTRDAPPVDLCIRTGGEQRISNFLLWQMAYAELYFTEAFWPDFKQDAMQAALDSFAKRQRRFGKTDEQVQAEVSSSSC